MKKSVFVLAALALAACTAEIVPQQSSAPVRFTAFVENEPESKAVLAQNGESKPQTFWEDGDAINVFTSADVDADQKVSGAGYEFSTTLGVNSTSATFTYTGGDFGSGKYFAIYPYRSHSRGVNYSGDGGVYKMAGVKIPESQTLVAGSFDKMAGIAIAFSENSTSLAFKNAVALLKFQVTESDILGGCIMANQSDAIAGTFRADVNTSTYEFSLETYSGVATYNYVSFAIDGTTPLTPGTDYYVAVRPTALTSGLKIYLNGNLVKTIDSGKLASLQRNKIYNLGALTTPAAPAEKALIFDFTGPALTGWPTADKWKSSAGEKSCDYPMYGTTYNLFLTDVGNATQARVYWGSNGLILAAGWRYVGLPAIPGYKLVSVSGVSCTSDNNARKAAISTNVPTTNKNVKIDDVHTFVGGGTALVWGRLNSTYRFNLTGTTANTMYYFMCYATGLGTSNLELVYEKTE